MSNCLVTGGAGFIGSHLVDELIRLDHNVIIIDNLSTGSKNNINPKAEFILNDICSFNYLQDIFRNRSFDIIFHLAAKPNVQESIDSPKITHSINVEGTHNLLLLAKEYKVPKFIFSSSSAIYGEQPTLPLVETMKPNPLSPYALHKLLCEQYCKLYFELYGIKTVSLRYFNVFGPRQNTESNYSCIIPKLVAASKSHNFFEIFGDGKQTRDFCYIDDVIKANIIAAFSGNNVWGETINVGSGQSHSVNEIVHLVVKYLKSDSVIKHGPKVIESRDTLSDTTKMTKLLLKPNNNFKKNLYHTIDSFI